MSWIKLDKKILDWEWFTDGNTLKVWIYLLVSAQQFEDTNYKGIELRTGQLITGRKQIMRETGLSEREVRTCLNRLKTTGEITIESTNQYSLITIVKYGIYQTGCTESDQQNVQQIAQQKTSQRPASDQPKTTSKILRYKDIKNIHKEEINKEESLACSPEMAEALEAFAEMRKTIKKPLTARAKQMILNKLGKLATDEETQIAILNQSTMNSWQGVFPLSQDAMKQKGMVNILDL